MTDLQWLVTFAADRDAIHIFEAEPADDTEDVDRLTGQANAWGREHHIIRADDEECARAHTVNAWARGEIGCGRLEARVEAARIVREHAYSRHPQ